MSVDELCDPERTLHIDSKVLDMAEAQEEPVALNGEDHGEDNVDEDEPARKLTKKALAEQVRRQVDTVGQEGKPGERIQKVISVGMLSEAWQRENRDSHHGTSRFLKSVALRAGRGSLAQEAPTHGRC